MMTMVVPKLLTIFSDTSALPASTNALIFLSNIFVNYWYLVIIFFIFVYLSVTYWKGTPNGRYTFDKILLRTPVL